MADVKPTVYMKDLFHPDAIEHAQSLFNLILPSDPEWQVWKTAEYLLMRGTYLNAADLDSMPNLLAIGKQGVGLDKIDIDACTARGIPVLNTPGLNAPAVAELVLTLTMCVARQVRPILVRQAAGEAVKRETCAGLSLRGRTIGIVGFGNIGKAVAQLFQAAFGAKIVVFRPTSKTSDLESSYTQVESLEELLKISDVVSIHVPLTASTRNLISYKELKQMKTTAILINTARGGIINEDDLARALSENLIFGAGIDVHEQEPPTASKYGDLWEGMKNIVSLPHVGATTRDAQVETGKGAINNLYRYIVEHGQQAYTKTRN